MTNADLLGQRRPKLQRHLLSRRTICQNARGKQPVSRINTVLPPSIVFQLLKRSKFLKEKKKKKKKKERKKSFFKKKRKKSLERILDNIFFLRFSSVSYNIVISTFQSVVATCRIVNRAPTQMLPKRDRLFRNMFKYQSLYLSWRM